MSAKPTDELLAALPEVGLRLVNLGEHTGGARWGCLLSDAAFDPSSNLYDGQGDTPAAALIMALRKAGVDVSDDPD
jgi:hypothetical protein